jgi:hypothetical protein
VPIKGKRSLSEFILVCQFVGTQEHQQGVFAAVLKQALCPTTGTFQMWKKGTYAERM